MSVDDVRMYLTRVQGKEVGEGLQRLQRVTHSANIDKKSNIDKLVGGVDLMLKKMKRLPKRQMHSFPSYFFCSVSKRAMTLPIALKKAKDKLERIILASDHHGDHHCLLG